MCHINIRYYSNLRDMLYRVDIHILINKQWTDELLAMRNWMICLLVWLMLFNPFVPNAPFFYFLKTSEYCKVFWCFHGVEKGCIGNKWVNEENNLLCHLLKLPNASRWIDMLSLNWKKVLLLKGILDYFVKTFCLFSLFPWSFWFWSSVMLAVPYMIRNLF